MSTKEEFKDALRRVIEEFRDAYPELDRVEIALAIAEIFKQFVEEELTQNCAPVSHI